MNLEAYVKFIKATAERYDGDGIEDAPGSPIINCKFNKTALLFSCLMH